MRDKGCAGGSEKWSAVRRGKGRSGFRTVIACEMEPVTGKCHMGTWRHLAVSEHLLLLLLRNQSFMIKSSI
jgi:hypothetical protein